MTAARGHHDGAAIRTEPIGTDPTAAHAIATDAVATDRTSARPVRSAAAGVVERTNIVQYYGAAPIKGLRLSLPEYLGSAWNPAIAEPVPIGYSFAAHGLPGRSQRGDLTAWPTTDNNMAHSLLAMPLSPSQGVRS